MEKFLALNPQFQEEYKLIKLIENKKLFKHIPTLENYLTTVKLTVLKKLFDKDFYNSPKLKQVYLEILKKEVVGVERMIFQILCNDKVYFDDLKLKFAFYKEFPDKMNLFRESNKNKNDEILDLLFQKVYLKIDTTVEIQESISKKCFLNKIFYLIALKDILNQKFLRNTLFLLKSEENVENWILGLTSLSESEFYIVLSSNLLNASIINKIKIHRTIEDYIDPMILCKYMLKETMKNNLVIDKMYMSFLKVIELMNLEYNFKLKILYALMRNFLYSGQIELFINLFENVKKAKKLDKEFQFYDAMRDVIINNRPLSEAKRISSDLKDNINDLSYSLDEIIKKYEDQKES